MVQQLPGPTLGADVSTLEAAHGEERQPRRLGQEARSFVSLRGNWGPPKPQSLQGLPKSTQRSGLKKPGSPRFLLLSQEIPSFINGG